MGGQERELKAEMKKGGEYVLSTTLEKGKS